MKISNNVIIVTKPTLRLTCKLYFLMMANVWNGFSSQGRVIAFLFPHYLGKFLCYADCAYLYGKTVISHLYSGVNHDDGLGD